MMGACVLLLLGEARSAREAIQLVRRRRCKQAVETLKQEKFVSTYLEWLRCHGVELLADISRRPGSDIDASEEASSCLAGDVNLSEKNADVFRPCDDELPLPSFSQELLARHRASLPDQAASPDEELMKRFSDCSDGPVGIG
mmetsp:Transcript_18625/g.30962  ORF Transcript_18625/g.30962 Transcript_18625/m.30962 type:complete len:142 (+) Transcript_18625:1-426(+)